MNATMQLACVDPRTDSQWSRLVEQSPSSLFHSPSWIQVLTDTYGFEASAVLALDDQGAPCAGLPFCRISDALGRRTVALPFSDYCDPLAGDVDAWRMLVDTLLEERRPFLVRCLHNLIPAADTRFEARKKTRWHGLDLRPGLAALWRGMHESTHRAIRKAQREGVTIRLAQSEDELRAFFEMHLRIRKYKYSLLAQPYSFFQNIWRHFVKPGNGVLLLAEHNGRIVAADFFLVWKDTLYYKFNASDFEALSCRPNDLLIWEGIQMGASRGLAYLDFGLCDWEQEGLARYKRKFGSEEKAILFLQHSPNGPPSHAEAQVRALLGQMTSRFTDPAVPDPITEKAGEDLYRLFT